MYCINCGTTNPSDAETCLKCGHGLGLQGPLEEPTAVDLALAERALASADDRAHQGAASSRPKTALFAVSAAVVIIVGGWFLVAGQRQGAPTASTASTTDTRSQAIERMRNGLPVRSGKMENDMIHKSGARKIQIAVEQYHAQHGGYPTALSEIPAGQIDIVVDETVYAYSTGADRQSYTIAVVMEATEVSGASLVNDNGVYKYILTSD